MLGQMGNFGNYCKHIVMKKTDLARAVTKISSCWVYPISRPGMEQLGIPFGFIFLLFPMKVARSHAHSSWGKSPAPGP